MTSNNVKYSELLKDRRWKSKSEEVKYYNNYTCQWCNASGDEVELHAHHPGYDSDMKPWEYPTSYFVCLCSLCHERLWNFKRAIMKNLHTLNCEQIESVFDYICYLQGRVNEFVNVNEVVSEFINSELRRAEINRCNHDNNG